MGRKRSGKATVFIQIPRTGGLLIADHLRRKLAASSMLTIRSSRELAFLRDDELAAHDFILAQTNALILRRLMDSYKITVMRDPLDRVLATYIFYCRRPNDTPVAKLASQMSLMEFVSSEEKAILHAIDNVQARRLAMHVVPGQQGARRGSLQLSGRDIIDRARETLDLFDAVGRFEALDVMAEQLRRLYGWVDAGDLARGFHELKPVDSSQLDARVLQVIRERTGIDQALYEEVRARFG